MELHSLKPAEGGRKPKKVRIGRGQGSGKGGTSARGHKGQQSRSGYKRKRNHEGGQMPLQMRLPKRGFKNINRKEYVALNIANVDFLSEKYNTDTIDLEFLQKKNVVKKRDLVKLLGNGETSKKLTISVHACSQSAKEKIEKQGGSVTVV